MPERLTNQQIERIINVILDNPQILERETNNYVRNNPIIRCHQMFNEHNDENAIHELTSLLRNSHHRYADLTDNDVSEIVADIRERFADIANITIDDWQNDNTIRRLVELHEHVKQSLQDKLHFNNVGWGTVSRIIASVFGNVPVITKSLKEDLYKLHFLSRKSSEDIREILYAIRNAINYLSTLPIWPYLFDLVIAFLPIGRELSIALIIMKILIKILIRIYKQQNRH